MRKEYKDAILGGIFGGIGIFFFFYLIRGALAWSYLTVFPVMYVILYLLFNKWIKKHREKSSKSI